MPDAGQLEKYLHHTKRCAARYNDGTPSDKVCTCGLDELRTTLAASPSPVSAPSQVIPDSICGICYHPFDACSHCDQGLREAALIDVTQEVRGEAVKQFRMDELEAVMLSVDKWLTDAPEFTKLANPATRAAAAREIALQAIERLEAKLSKASPAPSPVSAPSEMFGKRIESVAGAFAALTRYGLDYEASTVRAVAIACDTAETLLAAWQKRAYEAEASPAPSPVSAWQPDGIRFDPKTQTYVARHTILTAGRTEEEAKLALASAVKFTAEHWPVPLSGEPK